MVNMIFSIISLLLCIIGFNIHSAVKTYAQMNVPSYMKSKICMRLFIIILLSTLIIDGLNLINLDWYWALLITLVSLPIIYLIPLIIFERITRANFTYVTGGRGGRVWILMIMALLLSIIGTCV